MDITMDIRGADSLAEDFLAGIITVISATLVAELRPAGFIPAVGFPVVSTDHPSDLEASVSKTPVTAVTAVLFTMDEATTETPIPAFDPTA